MLPLLLELVALVGGTVHTQVPGEEPRAATVLLRDQVIEAILDVGPDGSAPELPAGTTQIDVSGMHVVPGLIDGMVNFDPDHDALYVSQGVTTIRGMGGAPTVSFVERKPERRDRTPGPTLISPGAVIDGDPPSSSEAIVLREPAHAEHYLPILIEDYDPEFLSVQIGLSPAAYGRVLEIGEEHALPVWGPVPLAVDFEKAIRAGHAGILFLDRVIPKGSNWEVVQPAACRPTLELLAEHRTAVSPLLHAFELRGYDQTDSPYDLDLLDPTYGYQWDVELAARKLELDDKFSRICARIAGKQRRLISDMRDLGVPLLIGSGAPHPWLFPGIALHEELAAFEQAGLPPAEVLTLATRGAAELLGIEGERGSLAPGLAADVVCVAGDPREGVAHLRDPEVVVVRGHVLERRDLDDMVATLARGMQELRADLARPIEIGELDLPEGALVLEGVVDVVSFGQRVRSERYAVVREPDGAVTYCGRAVYPAPEGTPPNEMLVTQRTRDGKLDEFEVCLRSADGEVLSRGMWTAEQMRIERRMDGVLIDHNRVRNRITTVDVGSVTSLLVLSRHERPGLNTEEGAIFQVLTFHEMLEPELAQWGMRFEVNSESGRLEHQVRTHLGLLAFNTTPLGSVELARNVVGNGIIRTELVSEDALGGAGLPLVPSRDAVVKRAREASATPQDAPVEGPAETPGDAPGDAPEDAPDDGSDPGDTQR